MPFRFPLAAVLRVRESLESREERKLQQLQIELSRLTLSIDSLEDNQRKLRALRDEIMTRPIAASHLQELEQFLQGSEFNREALMRELQLVTERRNKQMEIYMASHRDRELLTKLMIKQRDNYILESNRREQRNLDDLFSSRRGRNS